MNKKYIIDLSVVENVSINSNYVLLKTTLSDSQPFPEIKSGQFAELKVENSPATYLRRPISINYVDVEKKEIWFLIHLVGEGTRKLALLKPKETINAVLPLGNGFTIPVNKEAISPILIGGGVGVAPLLNLGKELKEHGMKPTFLLGARSKNDLLLLDMFALFGDVYVTTEDGSLGEKGFVTQHSILDKVKFDQVYCCGPKPMMVSVAKYAQANHIACEVSLENKMACGVGACLCCVENTHEGHLCVCKDGPVFKIEQLLWQI